MSTTTPTSSRRRVEIFSTTTQGPWSKYLDGPSKCSWKKQGHNEVGFPAPSSASALRQWEPNSTQVCNHTSPGTPKLWFPNIPTSEEGDVEPDDVAPLLLLTPFRDHRRTSPHLTRVRSSDAATGKPKSMATESAGPVSVPTTTTQEEKPSSGGGPGTPGPAGSVQVGVTLGYPSGLAGPTDTDTQERGRKPSLSPPELD